MTATKTSWFAPKLRDAMSEKGISSRQLCRVWRPGRDQETTRRSLNRYLRADQKSVIPGPEIRRELAEALGVDASEFTPDDDEETDLVAALISRLVRREVQKIVGNAVRREREAV